MGYGENVATLTIYIKNTPLCTLNTEGDMSTVLTLFRFGFEKCVTFPD